MSLKTIFLSAPLLLGLVACQDSTGSGRASVYRAVVESPHGAEGGAVLLLSGSGIRKVSSTSGRVFTKLSSSGARAVLIREPAGPLEVEVEVAAGHGAPAARVVEAVDGSDQPRLDISSYRVTFTEVEVQR